MWLPIFPLLAVLFLAAPSRSDDYDLIDKEDDQVVNDLSQIDTGIQLQMKHSKQCSRPGAGWKCKTGCYQSFLNTSGPLPNKCGSPISGDVCFGQELTYAHLETPSPFPLEYQILQNFPRCWAQLAPLICAVHYRPCVKQQVAFRAGDVGKTKVQTAIAELWSNLRAGYCYETVRVCQDVIKAGYFPSFINCSSSATQNSSIFTDSCSISSPPVPFKFSSNCPEPMVFFEGRLRGARPIMDQCYLKCRSDHFDRESRLYQNIYQATVGSGLTIVFLAAFFYLHFFSEAQRRSIVVFAASQSFLAISIWTTMWSLGSFLYHEVDCIEAGSHWIRRTEKPTDFLHWCVTQSMLINFAYSSAYLWLAAVAFFGLNCPSWLRKNEKTDFGWNVRSILLFGNYLTSGAVCIFLQLFHLHESDGVSGICLPGLQSTYSFWSLLAIPALSTSFIALSIGLYYRKYKIFWNESIGDGKRIASELHKYETEKRRKFLERVMRVKNPTAEQLRDVEERLVQNAIDDDLFSVNTIPDGPDDIAADKLMGSENPAGYLHRLVNSTKSSRNVARIKSGLPETLGDDEMEEIVDDAALHSVSKFVDHYWRHRQQFYLSFGFHWLLTASVLAIFVIWTSIPLHYFLIRNDPLYEEQSVRDYVHCALNSSISQKQMEWIHSGRPNAAFSNCNLPSYLPSQRASYVLLVFILFPTAPFLILIASIAAGLCGRGGMKTIPEERMWQDIELPSGSARSVWCNVTGRRKWVVFTGVRVHGLGRADTWRSIRDVVFYSHCSRSIQRKKACSLEDGIELIERERVEKPIPEKPQPLEEEQEEDESDSEDEEIPRKMPPKPKPPIAVVPQGSLAETPTTAPSCPPSGVGAEEKISVQPSQDGIGAASSSADRPSTSREGSDSIASVTARLLAFIKNYGSDSQGMHPMPPFREFEMLVDDLQAAGRRERILSHQHHIAMEAMRDLSAFVNFNSERLRIDMEMWNMIMSTLNQLASVADGLFPMGPEGRHVAPEHARLYEILLGISQMLNTVNPHLQEFERWRDVNTQASHRLRESVAIIFDNAVASTEHQAVRPIVENAAPHATPAEEKLTPQQPPVQQNDLQGNANPGPSQSPPQDAAPPVAETFSEKLAILRAERKAALAANLPVPAPLQSRPVAQNRARAENQVHGVAPVENQQITPRSAPQQRHAEMIPRPASPTAFRQAQVAPQNIGSAYMESYSAAPNGFYTRFSDAELSIRISRMNEIHGPQGFPQEYMYALILTGDIRLAGNDLPDDGERTVMPSDYPSIFGRAVPLDVVTPPAEFLRYMRRRAIIFVMSLGYDFNHRGRDNHNAYMPPTFPALGMSSTNELILVRIFGTDNLIRMKSLLCELIMLPWLRYSPQIPEVGGFAAYLDHFATIRGFPHSREEWVHDPFHSPTPRQYSPPPEAAVVAEEVPEEEAVAEEEDPEEELFVVDELPMEDEEEFPSPSGSNQ